MGDIKTVYVVTAGSYSDYHICAIFTDKAVAEEYAAQDTGDGAHVVEFPVDKPLRHPVGTRSYIVEIDEDGDSEVDANTQEWDEGVAYWTSRGGSIHARFVIFCIGGSEHAVKIANERRIVLIATGAWDAAQQAADNGELEQTIEKIW